MDSESFVILTGRRFSLSHFQIKGSHLNCYEIGEDQYGRPCYQYETRYKGTATLLIEPDTKISFNWIATGGEDEWDNGKFEVQIDEENPGFKVNVTLTDRDSKPITDTQLEEILTQIITASALSPIESLITQKFALVKNKMMKKHFGSLSRSEKKYVKHPLS